MKCREYDPDRLPPPPTSKVFMDVYGKLSITNIGNIENIN
jgi:hypothetical protein